jgi:hypothetical protein
MNSPWNWFAALGPSDRLSVVTFASAAVAFAFGLWQYRKGQKWRRMEWVAKEMDAFFGLRRDQGTEHDRLGYPADRAPSEARDGGRADRDRGRRPRRARFSIIRGGRAASARTTRPFATSSIAISTGSSESAASWADGVVEAPR